MLNRRRFLKLAGITALATAAPRIPLAFGGDEAEHGGLLHLTATEAVRHICRGVLSISRRVAPMIPAFHAVALSMVTGSVILWSLR